MEVNYKYISDDFELKNLIDSIQDNDTIYIDLEFDKNHFRYGFNLCLLQLQVHDECFLIDPLTELTIEALFPILENPLITKVCFSFGEDLRLLHYLGCFPKNIIDLAVGRSLLNKPVVSLSNFILEELGYEAGVSQQKSNWFNRPLTDQQCEYAAEDVLFLPKVYTKLMNELIELGRKEWLIQEMKSISEQDFSAEPVGFQLRKKDKKGFKLWEWLRYEKLIAFREELAMKLDRPSYKVVNKNFLIELAKKQLSVDLWSTSKLVYPSIRKSSVQKQVTQLLSEVDKVIQEEGINDEILATDRREQSEKLSRVHNRKQVLQFKELFFDPLRDPLREALGEHFVNFAFSNRRIEGVCSGDVQLLNYQKEILNDFANKFKLSIPYFIQNN